MPLDKESYDKGYEDGHMKGYERGQKVPRDEERRREALRAAMHIYAGHSGETVIQYANDFTKWLETGSVREAQP